MNVDHAAELAPPLGLLAELTHRCALACPYCSNPLALESGKNELPAELWKSVFSQAAALGVLQIHLSGGEPATRRDLVELVAHCKAEDLYTNLITSGVGVSRELVHALAQAGLDHVQLSVQDTDAESADRIAGHRGSMAKKRAVAGFVVDEGILLTVNAVVHRANIERAADLIPLAIELGAHRVEIAHAQYYGWALINRDALLPEMTAARRAIDAVESAKARHSGEIVVDHVLPDYFADRPKACMGGWGRRLMNVTPNGRVLPCHSADVIPGLEFWNVQDHPLAEIWSHSPAFNAFRGTSWMREPCRSCERRQIDFGGCRCQAMMLTGDRNAADPVCRLSPHHGDLRAFTVRAAMSPEYVYRRMSKARPGVTEADL